MRNKVFATDYNISLQICSLGLLVDALEQQKVHYEKQLAELRDQLQEVGEQPTTVSPAKRRAAFSPM